MLRPYLSDLRKMTGTSKRRPLKLTRTGLFWDTKLLKSSTMKYSSLPSLKMPSFLKKYRSLSHRAPMATILCRCRGGKGRGSSPSTSRPACLASRTSSSTVSMSKTRKLFSVFSMVLLPLG
jgi:hypothetical protein